MNYSIPRSPNCAFLGRMDTIASRRACICLIHRLLVVRCFLAVTYIYFCFTISCPSDCYIKCMGTLLYVYNPTSLTNARQWVAINHSIQTVWSNTPNRRAGWWLILRHRFDVTERKNAEFPHFLQQLCLVFTFQDCALDVYVVLYNWVTSFSLHKVP